MDNTDYEKTLAECWTKNRKLEANERSILTKAVLYPTLLAWNALKISAVLIGKVPATILVELAYAIAHLSKAIFQTLAVILTAVYDIPHDAIIDIKAGRGAHLGVRNFPGNQGRYLSGSITGRALWDYLKE